MASVLTEPEVVDLASLWRRSCFDEMFEFGLERCGSESSFVCNWSRCPRRSRSQTAADLVVEVDAPLGVRSSEPEVAREMGVASLNSLGAALQDRVVGRFEIRDSTKIVMLIRRLVGPDVF